MTRAPCTAVRSPARRLVTAIVATSGCASGKNRLETESKYSVQCCRGINLILDIMHLLSLLLCLRFWRVMGRVHDLRYGRDFWLAPARHRTVASLGVRRRRVRKVDCAEQLVDVRHVVQ